MYNIIGLTIFLLSFFTLNGMDKQIVLRHQGKDIPVINPGSFGFFKASNFFAENKKNQETTQHCITPITINAYPRIIETSPLFENSEVVSAAALSLLFNNNIEKRQQLSNLSPQDLYNLLHVGAFFGAPPRIEHLLVKAFRNKIPHLLQTAGDTSSIIQDIKEITSPESHFPTIIWLMALSGKKEKAKALLEGTHTQFDFSSIGLENLDPLQEFFITHKNPHDVQELDISGNIIKTFDEQTLKLFPNLRIIKADNNSIDKLNWDLIKEVPSGITLSLNSNTLSKIDTRKPIFAHGPHGCIIEAKNSYISTCPEKQEQLKKLVELSIFHKIKNNLLNNYRELFIGIGTFIPSVVATRLCTNNTSYLETIKTSMHLNMYLWAIPTAALALSIEGFNNLPAHEQAAFKKRLCLNPCLPNKIVLN